MPPQSPQEPQQPPVQPQTQTTPINNLPQYPTPTTPNSYSPSTPPVQQPNIQARMFSGRLNRIGYFLAFVFIIVYFLVPLILQISFRSSGTSNIRALVNIVSLIWGLAGMILMIPAGISINIRRWHDLNKSGWYTLLGLIPLVGYVLPIILLFVPGTKSSNNYGEPDTRPSTIRKVLFNK